MTHFSQHCWFIWKRRAGQVPNWGLNMAAFMVAFRDPSPDSAQWWERIKPEQYMVLAIRVSPLQGVDPGCHHSSLCCTHVSRVQFHPLLVAGVCGNSSILLEELLFCSNYTDGGWVPEVPLQSPLIRIVSFLYAAMLHYSSGYRVLLFASLTNY